MTQGCPQSLRELQVGAAGVHMFSPRKKVLDSHQIYTSGCGKMCLKFGQTLDLSRKTVGSLFGANQNRKKKAIHTYTSKKKGF
jgi:hypothetical protein